ncbi:unnamed protein product, partial [Cuscuta epithymum]
MGLIEPIIYSVEHKVTIDQNSQLLQPLRAEEIKEALFSMHPDKSPGPDGMSPGFYQHFWDVVGPDVVACCQRMFNSGLIPDGLNHTNIILIPKKDRPETIADWRP